MISHKAARDRWSANEGRLNGWAWGFQTVCASVVVVLLLVSLPMMVKLGNISVCAQGPAVSAQCGRMLRGELVGGVSSVGMHNTISVPI